MPVDKKAPAAKAAPAKESFTKTAAPTLNLAVVPVSGVALGTVPPRPLTVTLFQPFNFRLVIVLPN
jgi:hypothetical protein